MHRTLFFRHYQAVIGGLGLAVDEQGRVVRISFIGPEEVAPAALARDEPGADLVPGEARTADLASQLDSYFAGAGSRFDLALAPRGSDFQRTVWRLLRRIPAGQTRTYGQLAAELGRAGAARAVGRANATNPIPIVVPCHRVLGSNGSLTGFAGGLEMKRRLLELEGAWPARPRARR